MNYYLIDVLSTVVLIADIVSVISGIFTILCIFWYFVCLVDYNWSIEQATSSSNSEFNLAKKVLIIFGLIFAISLILVIFIPGEKTLIEMMK
jgi:uncharacterized membrane protein YesL